MHNIYELYTSYHDVDSKYTKRNDLVITSESELIVEHHRHFIMLSFGSDDLRVTISKSSQG